MGLILKTLLHVVPPFFLILAVLGSIFFGIATPTEASGLGAFGATLLALLNGKLSFAVIKEVCYKTSVTTAFIFASSSVPPPSPWCCPARRRRVHRPHAERPAAAPGGIVLAILFFAFLAGFFSTGSRSR
jgi:hypothetical protein